MTDRKATNQDDLTSQDNQLITKRTLKDLDAGPNDPKGGLIMKDTNIVRPTW
jgi:hypothetical protein